MTHLRKLAPDPGVESEYLADREALRAILPRARVSRDVDGTLIVTARAKRHAGNHLFVQARGRLVGLSYSGSPHVYLGRLRGMVERHLQGDGEGIVYLRWHPGLAQALPWFSRPTRSSPGKPFVSRHGEQKSTLGATQRGSDGSGHGRKICGAVRGTDPGVSGACPSCAGVGERWNSGAPCSACHGRGRHEQGL